MKPSKPNILFIFTDEQRYDTMKVYGNDRIKTPNLDRLAEESFVFENAYVTQPVCTPSRASIMTGLYPHTCGCLANNVPLKDETPTIAEIMKDTDYKTAYFGKWHLGHEIFPQHGFKEWRSIEDGYRRYYQPGGDVDANCDYYHWLLKKGFKPQERSDGFKSFGRGYSATFPEEASKPAYLAEEANRFMRESKGSPFILYINFLEPHMPFFGPYDGMYKPEEIPLPGNVGLGDNTPLKCRLIREQYRRHGFGSDKNGDPVLLDNDEGWKKLIARYWGLISLVDTYTGKILETLAECGLENNTIVVFTSDHGDMMGSHGLVAKCVMFEEAVKVPLLVRMPGSKKQTIVKEAVSQIDLVPTLLDMVGHPIPGHLEGKSLYSYFRKGSGFPREDIFMEWNGKNAEICATEAAKLGFDEKEVERVSGARIRTVITPDGWKLNLSEAGEHELYNLAKDPGEMQNLYGRKEYASVVEGLSKKIKKWQKRTGDDARATCFSLRFNNPVE